MKTPYNETVDLAASFDKKLLATDPRFNRTTIVQHEDGSHFLFMNAFACKHSVDHPTLGRQYFIVVFTEHHGTHVYDADEVVVRCIGDKRGSHKIESLESVV